MIRKLQQLIVLIVMAIVAGCATQPTVFTDYDASQAFDTYEKFAWISAEPMIVTGDRGPSPLVERYLRETIVNTLKSKGFIFIEDASSADFVVSFSVGARDRIEIREREVIGYYGSHWRWGYDYFGVSYPHGFPRTEVTSRQYAEGSLAIDIFDAKRKSPVWHGSASKRLSKTELQGQGEQTIRTAVETILAGFPPQ